MNNAVKNVLNLCQLKFCKKWFLLLNIVGLCLKLHKFGYLGVQLLCTLTNEE
jgi:hypothetical protein